MLLSAIGENRNREEESYPSLMHQGSSTNGGGERDERVIICHNQMECHTDCGVFSVGKEAVS